MTEAEKAEQTTNVLQILSGLAGPYAPYLQILAGNTGFIASFGDLAEKAKNGTLTKNDVLDVIQDATAIVAGVGVLTGTIAAAGWIAPVLGAINYLDRNDWDFDKVSEDVEDFANFIGFNTNTDDLYNDLMSELEDEFSDYLHNHSTIPENFTNPFINVTIQYDPLALDLDGDGAISVISANDGSVYFDHDCDGIAFRSSWVSSNDGLLVFDRNSDGLINNGSELFGNFTPKFDGNLATDGFNALSDFDTNQDGIISNLDENFDKLQIWQDSNSNGITDDGELKSLNEFNIESLNLNSITQTNLNLGNGNSQILESSFTKTDSISNLLADINFSVDTINREFKNELNLSQIDLKRPNVKGSGFLRDLNQAAVLNENLANLIDEYSNLSDKSSQVNLLDDIILEWAKTNPNYNEIVEISSTTHAPNNPNAKDILVSFGAYSAYANGISNLDDENLNDIKHKLAIINSFIGKQYENLYVSTQSNVDTLVEFANSTYNEIKSYIYKSLLTQTRLKDYLNLIELDINEIPSSLGDNPSFKFSLNYDKVIAKFNEIHATNPQKATQDLTDFIDLFEDKSDIIDGLNLLSSFIQDLDDENIKEYKNLFSNIFSDTGTAQADFILSNSNSYTRGGDGDDVMFGSNSNNQLSGENGNDIIFGGDGNDYLYGYGGNDIIYGGDGDDYIDDGMGNNEIYGGDGNDRINTSNGYISNNIVCGGKGDDTITGSIGDEVYIFDLGDGNDTISDHGGIDTLKFGPGISKEDLIVSRYGHYNLKISFKNSPNDSIIIKSVFSNDNKSTNCVIENLIFTNGDTLDFKEIKNSLLIKPNQRVISGYGDQHNTIIGDDIDNYIHTNGYGDIIYAGAGNDRIDGGYGDDIIYGEDGDDYIYGGYGSNDTLIGGKGNDELIGGNGDGNDIYIFNKDDGRNVIYESGGNDTIKFGSNLTADDIKFSKSYDDLVIKYSPNDQITIKNHFYSNNCKIENFELDDGSILTSDQINKIIQEMYAYDKDTDNFSGFSFADIQNNSNSFQIYG